MQEEIRKTIVDNFIELLESFGYPVDRQGSYQEGQAYPESFFTFWNGMTSDSSHYDNGPLFTIWSFDVNFYSTDPALVEEKILAARNLLKENGWIVDGVGYDVPSDEPTHTGRGFEALYMDSNYKIPHSQIVTIPDAEFPESIDMGDPERFSHLEVETIWK